MKLSTLLTLASSGGSSSSRNATDGTSSDAFGSLLNGMANDGSADSLGGQQNPKTTGSSAAFATGAIVPAFATSDQQAATLNGSTAVSVAGAVVPTFLSLDSLAAGTTGLASVVATNALGSASDPNGLSIAGMTGSPGAIAAGALAQMVAPSGETTAGTTGSASSAGAIAAGALAPTVVPTYQPAIDATVSAGVPVAGAVVTTDLSIVGQPAATTDIASASVTGSSGGKPQAVSSRQPTAPSDETPPRSDVAVAAMASVQSDPYVANGTDVASLLTLAARAADAPQNAVTPPMPVNAASGATTVAPGPRETSLGPQIGTSAVEVSDDTSADLDPHASGRSAKRRSATGSSDESNGDAQAATAAVPQVAAGLVATGMLGSTAVPIASAVTSTPADTGVEAPSEASAPGKDAATSAASASDATQVPLADLPQVAAIDDLRVPLQPSATLSPVDAAIVPGTVQVESHLGFLRSLPASGTVPTQDSRGADTETEGVANSGLETMVNVSEAPSALRHTSIAATAAASPTREAGTAGVGEADMGSTSAATSRDASLPSSPVSILPTSKTSSEEPGQVVPDMNGAAPAAPVMPVFLQSPQPTAPVAMQVADGIAALAAAVPDDNQLGTQVAPARSMALQLAPAGLGTLTVHLHVVGRALDVRLEASEGSTAALIDRDRDALSGALRGKDYQLQSLSVTTHDATMQGGTNAERGSDAGSADSGSSSPSRDGGSFGGRSGDQRSRETPDQASRPMPRPTEEPAVERGSSSLFV